MLDKKEIKAVNKVLRSKKLSGFVAKQSNNFNGGKYVNIFDNQDISLMKNLSLSNCLVKIGAKKSVQPNNLIEIIELNNGI